MRNNSLGDIIRTLRKNAGLSQEELADGICSPVSVSRIENGTQMPSGTVLEAILARLGTSTYQICDVYYKSEKQLEFEQEAADISRLVTEGRVEEAGERLEELEKGVNGNGLNRQYYLLLDATVRLYRQENADEVFALLQEALAQTKTSFDYADFRNTLLSVREANILSVMTAALFCAGESLKAIRMGEELMSSLAKHKSELTEYTVIRINLAFNLAQYLEKENRYQEAFEYVRMAEELSLGSFEQMLLPEIEFSKAKMYHLLGNDSESEAVLRAIVLYMDLIRKTEFAGIVRGYAKKELGLVI